MKRLLLIGGGHSHLFVLEKFAGLDLGDTEVTMVSPGRWQYYSGMIPGWIAGHYHLDELRIDLQRLADNAGVKFIPDRIVDIDAQNCSVLLADGSRLDYDILSLDTGSGTKRSGLEGCGQKLLTIKPLEDFQRAWSALIEEARQNDRYRLVVVGGGAAGVELALSALTALKGVCAMPRVHLVTGAGGILHGQSEMARRRAWQILRNKGVTIHKDRATGVVEGVVTHSGFLVEADKVLAATGPSAPAFLRSTGLSLDSGGFIKVDPFHKSVSHQNVFAAGDVCARDDQDFERSGVHAVRLGPILAHNLLCSLTCRPLKEYRPQKRVLYLLACGEKYAIASWGRFAIAGGWVWRWKNYIDRRFVARFKK